MTSDGDFGSTAMTGTWAPASCFPAAGARGAHGRLRCAAGGKGCARRDGNFRRPAQRSRTPAFCHKCDRLLFGHLSASR